MKFINKVEKIVKKNDSLLCVGLDSDWYKLPPRFKKLKQGQFSFNKWIIQQTVDQVCAYKINFAFYEARGLEGWKELELTIKYLRKYYPEVVTIADAKRGDIGNTNRGYAEAIFDQMRFDAVTVSPYLGQEALRPFLDRKDKGVIVLCKTSNQGSDEFQKNLWFKVAKKVVFDWNKNDNCWLVAGATYPKELAKIRNIVGDLWLLVPGVGSQGGEIEKTVKAGLNSKKAGMVINASRSIIFSDNPGKESIKLKRTINKYRYD